MVSTVRAKHALDCATSSYRFPQLISSLNPPGPSIESGKAVAAATAVQGAVHTVKREGMAWGIKSGCRLHG